MSMAKYTGRKSLEQVRASVEGHDKRLPKTLALQLRFPMVSCASGGLMGPSPE